jgi:hypothetical protein
MKGKDLFVGGTDRIVIAPSFPDVPERRLDGL